GANGKRGVARLRLRWEVAEAAPGQMRLMQQSRAIRRLPRERCARIRICLARFLSLVSPLVWLGFRRDYPISEAMTSFFFTFFKVFLNGCSGLFVAPPPRLLKIER